MNKKIITKVEFENALSIVRAYKEQIEVQFVDTTRKLTSVSDYLNLSINTPIYMLPLSSRTLNVLRKMDSIDYTKSTLEDISKLSMTELIDSKNAGRKTIYELQELCLYTGISMLA